jgi:hypothetical protein
MSRGETALADLLREIDVPTRVEKVPYLSPGAVVHEQVVAFGDDERHMAFDGDGPAMGSSIARSNRGAQTTASVSSRSLRSNAVYPSVSKVSGAPFRSGICADSAHNGCGDRRLARTRRSGDADDGSAALSEQPSGEFGQAVHRRFHAEILSPRSFESLE